MLFSLPSYGLDREVKTSRDVVIANLKVSMVIYHDDATNIDFSVADKIYSTVDELERFMQSEGVSEEYCKQIDLEIFLIPYDTLNNRDTMWFLNWSAWNNANILGMYDSKFHSGKRGSIYVAADQGDLIRDRTLAHELVHFWQDITCNRSGDLEVLAMRFERHMTSQ